MYTQKVQEIQHGLKDGVNLVDTETVLYNYFNIQLMILAFNTYPHMLLSWPAST